MRINISSGGGFSHWSFWYFVLVLDRNQSKSAALGLIRILLGQLAEEVLAIVAEEAIAAERGENGLRGGADFGFRQARPPDEANVVAVDFRGEEFGQRDVALFLIDSVWFYVADIFVFASLRSELPGSWPRHPGCP